uniref:STRA8 bHLH domain-containing protein n=1 Tax=Ornithorhynchus anatinus TaxID=9258 RepID=A0A6I8PQ63_ORNAN
MEPPGEEPRLARRRLSRARHRATLTGLFDSLRRTLYGQPNDTATKLQVLRKAKHRIQELEHTLENLLKLKDSLHLEGGNVSSLEEVKKDFVRMYSGPRYRATPDPRGDRDPAPRHPSGLRRTTRRRGRGQAGGRGVSRLFRLSAGGIRAVPLFLQADGGPPGGARRGLPGGGEPLGGLLAISHLWQELPEEKRRDVLQGSPRKA